jgi:hypothetical protein
MVRAIALFERRPPVSPGAQTELEIGNHHTSHRILISRNS